MGWLGWMLWFVGRIDFVEGLQGFDFGRRLAAAGGVLHGVGVSERSERLMWQGLMTGYAGQVSAFHRLKANDFRKRVDYR
jgi:hypothetical protein